jgi:hypothetical protein
VAASRSRYKTQMCYNWETYGDCSYGSYCQFAHGETDLANHLDGVVHGPQPPIDRNRQETPSVNQRPGPEGPPSRPRSNDWVMRPPPRRPIGDQARDRGGEASRGVDPDARSAKRYRRSTSSEPPRAESDDRPTSFSTDDAAAPVQSSRPPPTSSTAEGPRDAPLPPIPLEDSPPLRPRVRPDPPPYQSLYLNGQLPSSLEGDLSGDGFFFEETVPPSAVPSADSSSQPIRDVHPFVQPVPCFLPAAAPAAPQPSALCPRFCGECGERVLSPGRFCVHCGTPLPTSLAPDSLPITGV